MGCTIGIAEAPNEGGARMMRLGKNVVVTRQTGAAGPWFNVTWPGLVGVTTALAPGRFAGALNQTPTAKHALGRIGDWLVTRWTLWRNGRIAPTLLLRRAFEEAPDFDAAVRLLSETPICRPALYTLASADPGRGVVIERFEITARVHWAPVCVTDPAGWALSRRSGERVAMMRGRLVAAAQGLAWLEAPILNDTTRLAVTANASTGEITVQGFEHGAPATSVLRLVA